MQEEALCQQVPGRLRYLDVIHLEMAQIGAGSFRPSRHSTGGTHGCEEQKQESVLNHSKYLFSHGGRPHSSFG